MISHVNQDSNGQLASDSILVKGPHPHYLQPGNRLSFQEWYSLPPAERDKITTALKSRNLKLVHQGDEELQVIELENQEVTSSYRVPVSTTPIGPLPTLAPAEKPAMPDLTITPPDSIRLTVKISGTQPISLRSIPGAITAGIQRDDATALAVSLNRKILAGDRYFAFWHVVAYCDAGFCVVRILRPEGWNPQSEYATPPSADCGLMNTGARIAVNKFNQMQLHLAPVRYWQMLIKPLEYPTVANTKDLTEKEAEVIVAVAESLCVHLNVQRLRGRFLQLQLQGKNAGLFNSLGWNSESGSAKSLAQQLHLFASRFQTAAELVDALCEQDPTL